MCVGEYIFSTMEIRSAVATAASNSSLVTEHQLFCHSIEGWGPISQWFYDFTPCFLAVPTLSVALFGIIVGGFTIWWLLEKHSKQPTRKDWHYFTKLVSQELLWIRWSELTHAGTGCKYFFCNYR
jgi:hypothetical protein